MKIQITFKTPDALDAAFDQYCEPTKNDTSITMQYEEGVVDTLNKFIKYGEQVTIEFDFDAGTATVVPVR